MIYLKPTDCVLLDMDINYVNLLHKESVMMKTWIC